MEKNQKKSKAKRVKAGKEMMKMIWIKAIMKLIKNIVRKKEN